MGMKGKRKYYCDDCHETQMIHWVEFNRASRPRCMRCGSQRLEPHTKEAKDDILIGNLNVAEADPNRGSLMVAEPSPANRVRRMKG